MEIKGIHLIGSQDVQGSEDGFTAFDPTTGEALEPVWQGASEADVDAAVQLAEQALPIFRETLPEQRAAFLETAARKIEDLGDVLIQRAMQETGLPRARLEGERARTVNQLRLFARVVRDGDWLEARIDRPLDGLQAGRRSDIRTRHIPLGPVAIFGASNFPLAFSVAGGDSASALAAGAPIVVKAHPAHPGTSELVGRAMRAAVQECGLPEGVFSLVGGVGHEVGRWLVSHPGICAVGFTGSRQGGLALMHIAAQRPIPIPVYAEMSSINPVFLFPGALAARTEQIAQDFVVSLTGSAGQLCTNPGLVVAVDGPPLQAFIASVSDKVKATSATTMLTDDIATAYAQGVSELQQRAGVELVAQGRQADGAAQCQVALMETSANAFIQNAEALGREVFGAFSLIVKCDSVEDFHAVAEVMEGQLTATLQIESDTSDYDSARLLMPVLERKVGRILANGFPTGVEVCDAMVHGGPFPATTDSRTTSVGTMAIWRFLRPVCYQDLPAELLPAALADANPWNIPRAER